TGLLLVEVLRQVRPNLGYRTLHVNATDEARKVPDIDPVLLLEMKVQERLGHLARYELGPRPVLLSLHHRQQSVLELAPLHATSLAGGGTKFPRGVLHPRNIKKAAPILAGAGSNHRRAQIDAESP